MDETYPLAFHDVDAGDGGVEQDVHQMVFQQVDLIYVDNAAIGLCQYAGEEPFGTGLERVLEIDGPDQAVFRGVKGEVHHPDPAFLRG